MSSVQQCVVVSLTSNNSLEHKQETYVISSAEQYIALVAGFLMTSRKEDKNVNVSVSYIVPLRSWIWTFSRKGGVINFILGQNVNRM